MEASTASPPPQAAKGKPVSGYMVLALEQPGTWKLVGLNVRANSPESAITIHGDKAAREEVEDMVFVAIAARYWKPKKATPKTTYSLALEDVSDEA